MDKIYKIISINPGSTSTKVAVFENDEKIVSFSADHPVQELKKYKEIIDQLEYRKEVILEALKENNVDLSDVDAFSGRCTGLLPMPGGVYEVNDLMVEHGSIGIGSRHPGNLGPIIARDFAREFGGRAFVVNPSSVDEFELLARLTGLREVLRTSRGHPLNQKEVAINYAASIGRKYSDINVIVCHMGGGISIGAHEHGKMVDMVDSTCGEGRMAPTRTGTLPAAPLVKLCFSGKYTEGELLNKIMKTGGWTDLLGTADAREVEKRIANGDKFAEIVMEGTVYQVAKDVAAMAAVMYGKVDAILLTGGLVYYKDFVRLLRERVSFLAPVVSFPGEFEMEGLASGALRVLRGEEEARSYTGEPVFRGFKEELGVEYL